MTELTDLSETDASNTTITSIDIDEGCAPSGMNNAVRNTLGLIRRAFKSSIFRLRDSTDQTKLLAFDLSGLTTATTRTVTLPDVSGTMALSALATPQASTSGTSIDFTSIPAGTKHITVTLVGVSTSGTSPVIMQLGDSGGIEATGYLGSGAILNAGGTNADNWTAGFGLAHNGWADTNIVHGSIKLSLHNASTNTWTASGAIGLSNTAQVNFTGGSKSLSAALDRVRITTAGGSDTFDAGSINISYGQ